MSTEGVFEYHHKKFDHRKRSRDDDSFSTESDLNLSFSSSSLEFTRPIFSNSTPKRKRVNIVHQQPSTSTPQNVYQSMVQLMNFDHRLDTNSRPRPKTILLPMNGTIFTADNRISIKSEPIDYSISQRNLSPIRIEPQPISSEIKTEPLSIHTIKQELFELNNTSHLAMIPKEAYEDICKYRSNMARKFPRKERSSKELERRVKNTFACRKSRRIEKIQQVATEEEYKFYKQTNLRMEECALRAAVYLKELMKLTEKTTSDVIL